MSDIRRYRSLVLALALGAVLPVGSAAQQAVVLGDDELTKMVPAGFYFEGQVGPTQMRNAAAVRFAPRRNVVVALVDTSGYASNIRDRYEGFLITDSPITIGGTKLATGAYGFGFTQDGKMNIFDVGGKQLQSIAATRDAEFKGPRPLTMTVSGSEVRLYRGRSFVAIK
jgi:hypothetical protein